MGDRQEGSPQDLQSRCVEGVGKRAKKLGVIDERGDVLGNVPDGERIGLEGREGDVSSH